MNIDQCVMNENCIFENIKPENLKKFKEIMEIMLEFCKMSIKFFDYRQQGMKRNKGM